MKENKKTHSFEVLAFPLIIYIQEKKITAIKKIHSLNKQYSKKNPINQLTQIVIEKYANCNSQQ